MKTKFHFDAHGDASTTADLKTTAQPQRREQPPATDDRVKEQDHGPLDAWNESNARNFPEPEKIEQGSHPVEQKWTVERISKITGVTKNARHLNFQKLADEINAALNALRELLQGSENHHLRQQLLQAQAAIAELPKRYAEHLEAAAKAGELGDVDEKYQVDLLRAVISDIDLSALDKHDAS